MTVTTYIEHGWPALESVGPAPWHWPRHHQQPLGAV